MGKPCIVMPFFIVYGLIVCGIAGILQLAQAPLSIADLRGLSRYIAHRGPDGEGYFVDGPLGLAHRRLAIIDLATGDQPMSSHDGRYTIIFVGEIYNFIELRAELRQWGHQFATDSDTEVILAAYAQWGEACQKKFNGMWTFAIWDKVKRQLFLSRDRFGVKPLYYLCDGKRLVFASELKGFLGLASLDRSFDREVFALAIANYPILDATEHSLLRDVRRLRAGHSLSIRLDEPPKIKRWWRTLDSLRGVPDDPRSQSTYFRDLFLDACALRMRSDVPLATALSGGLDSSAVHCAMVAANRMCNGVKRRPSDWQKAFIAGFAGTSQDETEFATEVANYAGSEAVINQITQSEVIDHLPDIIYSAEAIHDLPSPAWLLYRAMRRAGVRVSLDGHGGDELFGGYHHHVREVLNNTKPHNQDRFRTTLQAMYVGNAEGVRAPQVSTEQFLNQEPRPVEFPELAADQEQIDRLDPLTQRLYMDFHYYTLPNILENFDRASMAHGVEVRAPFLDWRLVSMAHALPWQAKIGHGFTKYLVRDALRGLMPHAVVERRSKLGFITPFEAWIDGPLGHLILDATSSRVFLEEPLWDGPAIRGVAERAIAEGDGPTTRRIWPFVQASILQTLFREAHTSKENDSAGADACATQIVVST